MPIVQAGLPIGKPGGCASKLPTIFIDKVIEAVTLPKLLDHVIVGLDSKDDAAVYSVSDTQALVLSVDYGFPFCSDPYAFGAIISSNALSDIYAMGARPIIALSILGAPDTIPESLLIAVAKSSAEVCASVGVPIVGGHSAESAEMFFGLAAVGMCHPSRVVRNCTAHTGDKIILTKPLGFGLYAQAIAQERNGAPTAATWALGQQLNSIGADLADAELVSAMTDVTGFGLLGHLYEMVHRSQLRAHVHSAAVPALPECRTYIEMGLTTGAGLRNRSNVAAVTAWHRRVPRWLRFLLAEPETNGGLLLSVNPSHVDAVMNMARDSGLREAAVIGEFICGPEGIEIT